MPYRRSAYRGRRRTTYRKKSAYKAIKKMSSVIRKNRPFTRYDGWHREKMTISGNLRYDPLTPWQSLRVHWNEFMANPALNDKNCYVNQSTDWINLALRYRYYRIKGFKLEIDPMGHVLSDGGDEVMYALEIYSNLFAKAELDTNLNESTQKKFLDYKQYDADRNKIVRYYNVNMATRKHTNLLTKDGWRAVADNSIDFGQTQVTVRHRSNEFEDVLGRWTVTYYVEFKDRNPFYVL